MEDSYCIFCIEDIQKEQSISLIKDCSCKFNYHDECFMGWYEKSGNSCPVCRNSIVEIKFPPSRLEFIFIISIIFLIVYYIFFS